MLFAVVLARTDFLESELDMIIGEGIVSKEYYDKVFFKGFIEGNSVDECKDKVIYINKNYDIKCRLYGCPFDRDGKIICNMDM